MIQIIYLYKLQVQYIKDYAESQTLSCQEEENTFLSICFQNGADNPVQPFFTVWIDGRSCPTTVVTLADKTKSLSRQGQ